MKSKFKAGDRVVFTQNGKRFGQTGSVEFIRKDGGVIVHFDDDPPGTIVVMTPLDIDKAK